mgnify:CR=1 FL=1
MAVSETVDVAAARRAAADLARRLDFGQDPAARLALDIAAKPPEARLPLPAAQWSPGVLSINANTAQQLGIDLSSQAQAKASQVYR